MKKDVLVLSQFFFPEYITSAILPFETAVDLRKKGYSVDVLCGYPKNYNSVGDVKKKETVQGINIRRINYPNFNKNNFVGRLLNYFAFTMMMFLNIARMRDYKTIIVYSTPPVLPLVPAIASKWYGPKLIFISYDIYPEVAIRMKATEENSMISKMMKIVNGIVFNNVSKVVALSTEMKQFIVENRSIRSENVNIIPNWANEVSIKHKSDVSNPLFKDINVENKTVISYFGNMGTAQDMQTILETIRELKDQKDIHFLFAGHGNKMDILREEIQTEKLKNVTIYDFLHGQDFVDAQSISDAFIVSLEKGLDGLCVPSKTYSYMSAGRPIISIMNTDCDISQDLINHNAGFAISNGESKKMAELIESLRDKELVAKMSLNCKELFEEKYSRHTVTAKYAILVQKLLEENDYE